jgi:hypothetical protein
LGCLLHNLTKLGLKGNLKQTNLIRFSTQIWPQNRLDNSSKWPKFGTFDANVLQDLDNFMVRNGKWQEAPYLQGFLLSQVPTFPLFKQQPPSKSFF